MDTTAPVLSGSWNYPTPIWSGPGRVAELPAACAEQGIRRPLVVTDPGLARLPLVAELRARLEAADLPCRVFSEVRPNPVEADVEAGVQAYREADCDGVIALGGGSPMDVAKAVALMAGHPERALWDFEDIGDNWTGADPARIAPIVAIPTTAGTGSEVGRCAVIVDEAAHRKVILFHPRLMPGRVIADPELTVGLPPHLTAATGMDALAHNLEAWCAPGFHPQADGIALAGMGLVHQSLVAAYTDGSDIVARARMLAASTMGATAFQKGLGGIHAISHPVGALFDTHHGLTNAVVMPYVLVSNRPAIEGRMVQLAAFLGLQKPGFQGVLAWILRLRRQLGVPHALSALGVSLDAADRIAEMALVDPTAATNPVPLDLETLRRVTRDAIRGELDA